LLKRALLCLTLLSAGAHAEFIQLSTSIKANNDCNAYFDDPAQKGRGFEQCNIFSYNDFGEYVKISPVIAKFGSKGSFQSSNLYGDDIDRLDWRFLNDEGESRENVGQDSTGTWRYDDGQGALSYPGIRFWSAKAGRGFNLFWQVDSDNFGDGKACTSSSLMSLACLSAAESVLEGTWSTPKNKKLSHMVFYNSKDPAIVIGPGNGGGLVVVSAYYSAVPLFALLLLGLSRRQKRSVLM